jgi:apolipoprotein N-acyltransferase
VLAITDYFNSEDPVVVVYIPTKGVTTIYSRIGDLFTWLCLAGLAAAIIWVVVRRRATKATHGPTS